MAPEAKSGEGIYEHTIPGLSTSWETKVSAARDDIRPFFSSLETALSHRQARVHEPPAWLWLLVLCYERYPPPSMDKPTAAREASTLRSIDTSVGEASIAIGAASAASPTRRQSVKLLRRALVHYHPDKNRAEQHGVAWAAFCEEIAKLATGLLAEEMHASVTEA